MTIPPLYSHQETMAEFGLAHNRVLNTSDPGTGKTRGTLEAYARRLAASDAGRMLVVAPLSILVPAWGNDISFFFPQLTYTVAHGSPKKRLHAFLSDANIVLINHDGVKWLTKRKGRGIELSAPELLNGFTDLVIDEFTAFKHRSSQRSRAMKCVSNHFNHITLMSGTPNSNTVLDIWHPMYILDDGARLGNRYFHFRSQVCTPQQVGPLPDHVKWIDRPGAEELVAQAVDDVSIRFKFEDCVDIPEHSTHYMTVRMPAKVMAAYAEMQNESEVETKKGRVSAVNAAARITKMLQILSGAVYDTDGNVHPVHNARYDLVLQLVIEREHSLVAFNWKHEKDALCAAAEKLGITFAVIDGSVPNWERTEVVKRYQNGEYRVLFCHPQSAGHGLTLTRGTTTIWCSPTYNAEHFQQFNRRIYRAGQDKRTETICIAAENTKEVEVYEKLNDKLERMEDLLELFKLQTAA